MDHERSPASTGHRIGLDLEHMTDLLRENKMQDQEGSQFPLPMNVAPFAYALIGTCSASSLASVVGFAVQAFLSHNMELHF